jgi:hypothetical protein
MFPVCVDVKVKCYSVVATIFASINQRKEAAET